MKDKHGLTEANFDDQWVIVVIKDGEVYSVIGPFLYDDSPTEFLDTWNEKEGIYDKEEIEFLIIQIDKPL